MGVEKPATIAVVNKSTGEVITYKSLKQLLGKNYKLLNLQRRHKQKQSHHRHIAQRNGSLRKFNQTESELGQYIDRLWVYPIFALSRNTRSILVV